MDCDRQQQCLPAVIITFGL